MRFYDDTCYCSRSYHNTNNNSDNSWVIVANDGLIPDGLHDKTA